MLTAAHFAAGESLLKAAGTTRVRHVQRDPRWGVAAGFGVLTGVIGDALLHNVWRGVHL